MALVCGAQAAFPGTWGVGRARLCLAFLPWHGLPHPRVADPLPPQPWFGSSLLLSEGKHFLHGVDFPPGQCMREGLK